MSAPDAPTGSADTARHSSLSKALASAAYTLGRICGHPANRGRRSRALALYIVWQAWQRVVRRPWTIRLGDTRRIRLYPHSVVAAFVLYYRVHDYEEMSFVRDYLKSGDLFVDVGANVGVYSLWASETKGVDVLAFEPAPLAYRRAVENFELNGLVHKVVILQKAVGPDEQIVSFTTRLDAINHVAQNNDDHTVLVEQTTLDHQLGFDKVPALVKVDVEGGELGVLRGGEKTIDRNRPALIIEMNDPEGVTEFLAQMGYQMWSYDPEARALVPTVPALNANVIALADIDEARARLSHLDARPKPRASSWLRR